MGKRGGYPGGMGGFGGVNINQLMKQAKQMQADMEKDQEQLSTQRFSASAGGGAVKATVTGDKKLESIILDKSAVDPDDVEMLQDLILTCVNEALRQVDSAQAASLGKYNIPGFNI
jgi:hypothetical protein